MREADTRIIMSQRDRLRDSLYSHDQIPCKRIWVSARYMQRVLIRGIKDFNVLRLSGIIIINNTESERGNMPRKSRKKSESGYYHVILRGVNRQDIFFDHEDREKMLNLLRRYQDETDVRIIAYCLMDNHIHLLLLVS